jgi:hypothetical protein
VERTVFGLHRLDGGRRAHGHEGGVRISPRIIWMAPVRALPSRAVMLKAKRVMGKAVKAKARRAQSPRHTGRLPLGAGGASCNRVTHRKGASGRHEQELSGDGLLVWGWFAP